MDIRRFMDVFYSQHTTKEITNAFNSLVVTDRKIVLEEMDDTVRKEFINDIRKQAVKDFWYHEREAIMKGQSTYNWTPLQIEYIMNLSPKTGNCWNIIKDEILNQCKLFELD